MTDAPASKRGVRAAFDRAAAAYDSVAHVQRSACDRLFALGTPHLSTAARVVDAGCGTGYALPGLRQRFPDAELCAVDFAPAMLARLPAGLAHPLCADLEQLPVADARVDLLWSSYALQWCAPRRALTDIARVLRPGGQVWLATLGPGTLFELRDAFAAVDDAEHVLRFQPPEVVEDAAESAGLRLLASERDTLQAWAPDLRRLLHDIKTLGAHQTGATRRPLRKTDLARLTAAYEAYRTPDGLPASYDTLWLVAEKP